MKTPFSSTMFTVKSDGSVTIKRRKSEEVVAVYSISTDTLQMHELVTFSESDSLLALARAAAASPKPYEDSRDVEIRKRSRAIAKAALIGVAMIIIIEALYLMSIRGCI